jgi:hypothetical protein
MKKLLWLSMLLPQQAAQAEPVECVKASLYAPKGGVIPSGTIAKNIATTYLGAIYGAKKIRAESPLTAKLHDGVWTVEGHLPHASDGGVAIIRLCRRNGTVLSLIHEK